MDIAKINFGGKDLIIESGKLAKQANGSVTVQYGGTLVLVTACMSSGIREGLDFFPLTVEYQEKTYAAGRIPGGFFKREGRPSESEILCARLIDRPIRPLFPKGMLNDVQVMAIVLSSDGENDPDVLAVIGASTALCISDIPFSGSIAACRVGYKDNELLLNPSYTQLENSSLDLVVAASKAGIVMLEAKSNQVSEEIFLSAVEFGWKNLQDIFKLQEGFIQKNSKPKRQADYKKIDPELQAKVEKISEKKLKEIFTLNSKEEREDAVSLLNKELQKELEPLGLLPQDIKTALTEVEKQSLRNYILKQKKRLDNRKMNQIRQISCEVAVLPRTHGSGLFTRGQTQSLCVTTLGTGEDEQLIEALEGEKYKSFMLHYSFPPFSVGETKPVRGPGRREIGHGALAERALASVMPSKDAFPYTVRVVSEILESNGSSSMATVCAASLSLMDAGVPIQEAVGGIALGLIKEGDQAVILTDIAGLEDHFGDMDFKVAGTRDGITAAQLDMKIEGISIDLLKQALAQAKEARSEVLDKINAAIDKPRSEIAEFAPHVEIVKIATDKIGDLIGPGGKNIKRIISATGATIDIQDDGRVIVGSSDRAALQNALAMVRENTEDLEIGKIYTGKIKRIMAFGAFCQICPGKEGLIHVSELADHFVKEVTDEVKIGDEVRVKVVGIDQMGRINLSRKQVEQDSKE
ncbi:MAG: polyribonucleotide nucleotidyltransferase [Candidatus Omnitrophica bacterium]|nr:polyribonucleotide nucleotidyltransferase [Candidatus Omnitrophota bacterium]